MGSLLESHRRGVRRADTTDHIHLSKIQWNQKQRLCVILFMCVLSLFCRNGGLMRLRLP